MDDVITFIVNIITLGIFWVKIHYFDSPMILNSLMGITDLITFTEYRCVNEKYKGSNKYMTQTLVVHNIIFFVVLSKL